MRQARQGAGCGPLRSATVVSSRLGAVGLALLVCMAPQTSVAQELTPPAAVAVGSPSASGTDSATTPGGENAVSQGTGSASTQGGENAVPQRTGSAAAPGTDGAAAQGNGGVSAQGNGGTAARPEAATALSSGTGSAIDGVSAGMPVWKLFVVDARSIFTAPAHWTGHDWAVFGIGAATIAGLTLADKHLRTEALRGDAPLETTLANDFRYFGNYATFSLLGAFYIGGRIGHDNKAQETALDGLVASVLAGGIIAGVLKEVTGRYRPSTHKGVYSFRPFSGNASFPSGESTEAFAAGSVIAAQYPHLWVEIAAYGTASLVAFARMREDGHWASDVVAGALLGTTVGRAVVHLNKRLRARVSVAPLLAPRAQGVTITTGF